MAQSIGIVGSVGSSFSSGTSNSKSGTYALGTASADFSSLDIHIIKTNSNDDIEFFIDVLIDGVVVAENLLYKSKGAPYPIPCKYKIYAGGSSGNVVGVRIQSNGGASRTIEFYGLLYTEAETIANGVSNSSYGADTSTTSGVFIDCGAVADTASSPVELTTPSGLEHDADALLFTVCISGDIDRTAAYSNYLYRVYTGPTGASYSGVVMHTFATSAIDLTQTQAFNLTVDRAVFSAGTRVWLTGQCSVTDVDNRLVQATMNAYELEQAAAPSGGTIINDKIYAQKRT